MKLNRLWLLLVLLLSTASDSLAQKQFNNWYFGSYSGLNFNTNPPTFQKGALITAEGSAGVSDANGNLLFYTDGITVYNRRHLVMPNGFGLLGHSSSTHSALIVPDPASPHRYYVFTTGTVQQTRIDLHYSIVDMREDGGQGDVVFKNMRLLAQSTEHIIGVSACGEDNYWIITRKLFSNDFYAWYLDASGIGSTPVISTVDVKYGKWPETGAGWLTSNPKGDMLAMAHGSSSEGSLMQLFKFDRNTGIVSDPISLPGDKECYAAAFSADGSKVYFGGQSVITKLDVTVYEKSAILATQYSVPHGWRRGVTLKLAPDKNIYARGSEFLGRITNANSDGFAFDRYFMVLPPGNEHSVGLPNDPIKNLFACPLPTATLTISDDSVCESNCIEFTAHSNSEITEWNWSFEGGIPGTSNLQEPPSICYSKSGSYNVRLIVSNEQGSDTVVGQVSVLSCPRPAIVLADTTICISECITFVDTSTLSTTWKWEIENGIPSTDISRVTQPICYSQLGEHKVRLIAANEYGADTAECLVTVIDCSIPKARVQHDTSICVGKAIDFRDQSEGEIKSFSWEFSEGTPPSSGEQHPVGIRYDSSGRHRVRLIATNDAGSDTVESWVTVNECEPPVAAISDHTICEGDSILFTDESMNYPSAWQWKFDGGTPTVSGSRDPGYVRFDEPGIYPVQLIASNEYGSDTADATITVISASPTIRPAELAIEQPLNTCITFDTAIWIHAGCKEVMYELESSGMMYIDV
ncbi:MAG TPA: PKD domain-containing protein, partial [Candidatus Kapabacteria bacterium]|nr:PKD domain-containing protein [Candidatus Kapabacteria bacterium]